MAFLWATGSGLTPAAARAGYGMFCERASQEGAGKVRGVRIKGDGFDVSFGVEAGVRAARRLSGPSAPRDRAGLPSAEPRAIWRQRIEGTAPGVARSPRARPQINL